MKKVLFVLFILLMVTGCSKTPVNIDAAKADAGQTDSEK